MSTVMPFGATSLHDAIARTAERAATREGRRRAVVVFTDGNDNASRLTPAEVSGIASAIDVPVYIVGVVSALDDPASSTAHGLGRTLAAHRRARESGGVDGRRDVRGQLGQPQRSAVARQIVDEMRHQYLIAIESSAEPGWHRLTLRVRNRDLTVRARSGYIVGQ